MKDRKYYITDKNQEYWKNLDEYFEKYYFKKIVDRKLDPLTEFKKLLAEDMEDFSLYKAKKLAIRYNLSEQVIADAIRPYKYGSKRRSYHKQLRADRFWGKEEWDSDDNTIKPSFFTC